TVAAGYPPFATDTTLLARCFKENLLQNLNFTRQFFLAGRKFVEAKKVSDDVSILLPGERSRTIRRHRDANSIEQIAHGQTIPVPLEATAGKGRCHIRTF